MKQVFMRVRAFLARNINYLRRRRHAIKTYALTRKDGIVRYYDTVAIPQTLEKELYDVQVKRYRPGRQEVETVQMTWTRARVMEHAQLCWSQNPWRVC
jgi:hypothetical protein